MGCVPVAAIQMNILPGDPKTNRRHMRELAVRALDGGARLVLLPEMAAPGYDLPNLSRLAEPIDGDTAQAMSALAAQYHAYVAWGMAERDGEPFHNTLALAGPDGNLLARYRKTHLIPLLDEPDYFTPGDEVVVVPTEFGTLGLSICYDLRFPGLFQRMAAMGAEVFLLAAQWPQSRAEHWRTLTTATALQNLAFVVTANGVGMCAGDPLAGRSVIASPWGERIAEAGDSEEILYATLDLAQVAEARAKMPVFQGLRPDLYC
jgi:omega-amidase